MPDLRGHECWKRSSGDKRLTFAADSTSLMYLDSAGELSVFGARPGDAPAGNTLPRDDWTTMQLSPDGRLLATGAKDGAMWLWDTRTWEPVAKLGDKIAVVGKTRGE